MKLRCQAAVAASLANEPIATFFGYRILEIAAHLGVHYSTVSRRLNEMEQEEKHVALQDVALNLLNVRSGPGPVR
jgi:DNA-binding MarR family transcriptional regulator